MLSLAVSNERGGSPGGSALKNLLEMLEMQVRSLSWENTLEEGHGNPLQYSCLENPMGRGGEQGLGVPLRLSLSLQSLVRGGVLMASWMIHTLQKNS